MARAGVTREQVFEAAEALVREGQTPTVVSVRTRLGGGSPNTITPLLAEWRALHDHKQAASLPPVPEPVEAVLRQVWGAAWQQAQGQLTGEREALAQARKAVEQERAEMLAEIARLDGEIEALKEGARQGREALEVERRTHEQTRSDAREARALAQERSERIAALETGIEDLRRQLDGTIQQASRLEAELSLVRGEGEALRAELATERRDREETRAAFHEAQAVVAERSARSAEQDEEIKALQHQIETLNRELQGIQSERDQCTRVMASLKQDAKDERSARIEAEQTLATLRIEVATLTERAAHTEELRTLVRALQGQRG